MEQHHHDISVLIRLIHVLVPAIRQKLDRFTFFQMEGLVADLDAEDPSSADEVFAKSRIMAFRNTL